MALAKLLRGGRKSSDGLLDRPCGGSLVTEGAPTTDLFRFRLSGLRRRQRALRCVRSLRLGSQPSTRGHAERGAARRDVSALPPFSGRHREWWARGEHCTRGGDGGDL